MSEKSELDILNPGVEVTANKEVIKVEPFKFGQFAKVAKILALLSPAINANIKTTGIDFVGLIADGGEPIIDLLALSTGKPRAWFDRISGDEGMALVAAVIEQNKEEFTKKIAPSLAKLVQAVGEKEKPAVDGEPSTPS